METLRALAATAATAAAAAALVGVTGCAVGTSSTGPEERIEEFHDRFPDAPLPSAPSMDPLVVMLEPYLSPSATYVLYSDPALELGHGHARMCVSPESSDQCPPPVDQERRRVTVVDGFEVFLFSGPDNIGFDSPMADRVMTASWSITAPPELG